MEENPEYIVWFLPAMGTGHTYSALSVYTPFSKPLKSDSCVYRVKGEEAAVRRNYHELIAVMQLVGVTHKNGDVRAVLDRESILAVVPQWKGVI